MNTTRKCRNYQCDLSRSNITNARGAQTENIISHQRFLLWGCSLEPSRKFFLVALILSVISATSHNVLALWHVFIRPDPRNITAINLLLSPAVFACSVVLPFVVMYYQAKTLNLEAALMPVLVGIFLGTWIGEVASNIGINAFMVYVSGGSIVGYNIVYFVLSTAWQIVALALSSTLFIFTTAVFFAHYRKLRENRQLHPPSLHSPQ